MTSDFNSSNRDHQPSSAANSHQSGSALDAIQRDRFELLSAYMDGEVTADERRQVEDWLAHDPTVQRLHARLLKLRACFQTMPVPTAAPESVQQTVDAVLSKVERRPRLTLIWGGAAVAAAMMVAAVSSVLPGFRESLPQMAQSPSEQVQPTQPESVQSERLLIALDKPLVALPDQPEGKRPAQENN